MNFKDTLSATLIGVILWYVAAITVKFAGIYVFAGNDTFMGLMLLSSLPSTFIFLWLIKMITQKPLQDLFLTVVILTIAATLLDGVAMIWLRSTFYDTSYSVSLRGAAWILWGVGMGLLAAYLLLPSSEKLSSNHALLSVVLGVAFWFNGAIVIRFMGEYLLTDNNPQIIWGLVVAIPVTVITIVIAKYLFGLAYNQMLKPITVMTFSATSCDTVALTWFQSLYSSSDAIAFHGAALILWGAGLGLLFAYYLQVKSVKK